MPDSFKTTKIDVCSIKCAHGGSLILDEEIIQFFVLSFLTLHIYIYIYMYIYIYIRFVYSPYHVLYYMLAMTILSMTTPPPPPPQQTPTPFKHNHVSGILRYFIIMTVNTSKCNLIFLVFYVNHKNIKYKIRTT